MLEMRKLKLRKGRWTERWINAEPVGLSTDRGHRCTGQASLMKQNPLSRFHNLETSSLNVTQNFELVKGFKVLLLN